MKKTGWPKILLLLAIPFLFFGLGPSTTDLNALPSEVFLPVIINKGAITFQSLVILNPSDLEADVKTTVYATVAIDPSGLNKDSVELYTSDVLGAKGVLVGKMKDDGQTSISGDDVLGDNVYTLKMEITNPSGMYNFKAFALDTNGKEGNSIPVVMYVISKPTAAMVANAVSHSAAVEAKWETLKPSGSGLQAGLGAFPDAQQLLVDYIKTQSWALYAYKGTNGVFYAMKDSPFMMVQETIPNITEYNKTIDGGARGMAPPLNPALHPPFISTGLQALPVGGLSAGVLGETEDKDKVKDKKALFLDPYYWQHVNSTKMNNLDGGWTKIEDSKCPNLIETKVLNGNDLSPNTEPLTTDTAVLDAFTTLSNYGTVLIHTHGAYLNYSANLANWLTELETAINALPEGPVKIAQQIWLAVEKVLISWTGKKLMFTSGVFVDLNLAAVQGHKYWKDIMMGRLYVGKTISHPTKGHLLVTPAFIEAKNGAFPNSVIYAGACHSLQDESMSNIFLAKGAGVYYGFDESVHRSWNVSRSGIVFEKMLKESKTAKEAFDAVAAAAGGNSDIHSLPLGDSGNFVTHMVMKGNEKLKYEGGFQNLSFEDPKGAGSLQSWSPEGDARAWHSFQSDNPTQGGTMAVISSGLGKTTSYGSITQTGCLTSKANNLKFSWNFYSAEFNEWCSKGYDDTFRVLIDGTEVWKTSVDTLCGSGLSPTGPIDGTSFSDPDTAATYKTGWQNQTIGIGAYAGKEIKLQFEVQDKGDSAFDTAILIDNIIIEELFP